MSETIINTTDPLTRKRWAKGLFKVLQKNFEFGSLMGTGENAIIQVKNDLGKGMGDEMTFGIVLDLVGAGTVGRDTLEGKAEALTFRDFKLGIDKIRKSVDIGTDLDLQRVPYNLMQIGKVGLQNWWQNFLSDYMFHVLCGNSQIQTELPQLGGKMFGPTPVEPDTNHFMMVGGHSSEASLTAADGLTLEFLDGLKQRAELPASANNFKIRPLVGNFQTPNKRMFRCILHNYVFDQLRRNTNVGEWGDMLRAAQKLGDPMVEVMYNGIAISKSERVYSRQPNVYRNLFLGSQAAVWGWGGAGETKSSTMSFHVEKFDHGSKTEVSGGGIFGMAKTRFMKDGTSPDHGDYGMITFPAWGEPIGT